MLFFIFFFFQAEDGIRDDLVTGVQTCALPICLRLGMDRQWALDGVDAPSRQAVEQALAVAQRLGASVEEARFPDATQAVQDWPALSAGETAGAHGAPVPARAEGHGPRRPRPLALALG